ncbi:DNA (cytosine-5-)-methyltransferase [Virgibacillus sp. 7505]|uniref:DNA cytosine methyltransferase n=1 Tax=Virgibacillus sp. 7505 TaxID=2022548 RepID=UPI000BA6EDFF|nr:DNA (cytosine-5-)-methyltransferase [Virgibacillus sp. 7505]PAE17267.1 DNA (cytosine-5-)-methyltransferase [Virgibacillus sp. 7505]
MNSIELFAGIGGISLAAEWAGIETKAFCEIEPFAQRVLNKHWPDVPIFDDVRTLNKQALEKRGVDVGAIELITGGFPCQPYSIAGKRKGKGDDRDLWPEMFRIIKEIRPRWVVGENVANFVNMELDRTLFDLESAGYKGQSFVIPAAAIGAKHERMRTFVVAYSDSIGRDDRRDHREKRYLQDEQDRNTAEDKSERIGRFNRAGEVRSVLADTKNQGNVRRNGIFSEDDGASEQRNHNGEGKKANDCREWWSVEPDVGRVANGVPNRVDRIKGLGNAVVPQQIYPIFKAIMDIENRTLR